MIKLTRQDGYDEYVSPDQIVRISEGSMGQANRGVRSVVYLSHGAGVLEVRQEAAKVHELVQAAQDLQDKRTEG